MFKFRKKPVVIEAVQHFSDMGTYTAAIPVWLIKACADGTVYAKDGDTYIKALEGDHRVTDGDYIIQGVKGELYPCKPDIFAQTYEPA